jgi:hypothetical protein
MKKTVGVSERRKLRQNWPVDTRPELNSGRLVEVNREQSWHIAPWDVEESRTFEAVSGTERTWLPDPIAMMWTWSARSGGIVTEYTKATRAEMTFLDIATIICVGALKCKQNVRKGHARF